MTFLVWLWRWLTRLIVGTPAPPPAPTPAPAPAPEAITLYRVEAHDDEPERLEPHRVYLIGDAGAPWSVSLICPCGCQAIIRLSLLQEDRPHWRASANAEGIATLHPSIWRVRGCKSHFVLRDGRIRWSAPDKRPPVILTPPLKTKTDRYV